MALPQDLFDSIDQSYRELIDELVFIDIRQDELDKIHKMLGEEQEEVVSPLLSPFVAGPLAAWLLVWEKGQVGKLTSSRRSSTLLHIAG
jgi:hypothetical protein